MAELYHLLSKLLPPQLDHRTGGVEGKALRKKLQPSLLAGGVEGKALRKKLQPSLLAGGVEGKALRKKTPT